MDTTGYDTKIYVHLNDKTTYTTISHDHTDQFANKPINNIKQNGKFTPQLYNKFFPRGSFLSKILLSTKIT